MEHFKDKERAISAKSSTAIEFDFAASTAAAKSMHPQGQVIATTGMFHTHYTLTENALAKKRGADPLLVCMIHGLGGSSFVWQPLEKHLVESASVDIPVRVLKYDLIGRGFSHATPDCVGIKYTLDDYVNQLNELMIRILKLTQKPSAKPARVALIGHSMGGIIATEFASRQLANAEGYVTLPGKDVGGDLDVLVESMILLSPAGAVDPPIGGYDSVFSCIQQCIGGTPGCVSLLGNYFFSSPLPVNGDYVAEGDDDGPDSGLSTSSVSRGKDLQSWALAWCEQSTSANGGIPLAASIAHMPFTDFVLDRITRMPYLRWQEYVHHLHDEHPHKVNQIKVNILTGKHDRICKNIRVADYENLFGEGNVFTEEFPGRHCWFIQDHAKANATVTDILKTKRTAPVIKSPTTVDGLITVEV